MAGRSAVQASYVYTSHTTDGEGNQDPCATGFWSPPDTLPEPAGSEYTWQLQDRINTAQTGSNC